MKGVGVLDLSLRVLDVTDLRGLEGAVVEVRPLAVPRWFHVDNAGPKPRMFMRVDLQQADGPAPQTVTAGPGGRMRITFDMGPSFAAASAAVDTTGATATDVAIRVEYHLRYGRFERDAFVATPLGDVANDRLVLTPDADVASDIFVDLGFAIVGHTTDTECTVWATTSAPLVDGSLTVTARGEDGSRVTAPLRLLDVDENAGLALLRGLTPGSVYRFDISLDDVTAVLTSGTFRTDDRDADHLRFGFVSCNGMQGMERWRHLAAQDDLDLVLHMGDQIYEYGLGGTTLDEWRDAYSRRYRHHWRVPPTRAVLRNAANYMILDDHDVKDDLGVVPVDLTRRRAALEQYRLFQQSHGPRGEDTAKAHYSFRRGPAAFFVLDVRTEREEPPANALRETEQAHEVWQPRPSSVVLGSDQLADIEAWASSEEVRSADLVFLVAPTPFAWVPIPALLDMIAEMEDAAGSAGGFIGGLVGGLAGGLIGGPFGAMVGKEIGKELGEAGGDALADYLIDEQELLTSKDMADTWLWPPNQPDLVRLLQIMFDLGSDADRPSGTTPHARGVFVLGGDVHAGALHHIGSKDRRHLRNRNMLQVISSGIAQRAPTEIQELVEHLQPGTSWPSVVGSLTVGTGLGNERARFPLDTEFAEEFEAVNIEALWESNYGTFDVTRLPGSRRVYEVHVQVNGQRDSLVQSLRLDLDDAVVEPIDLIGGVGRVDGRITLHRVHRHGTGFGPSSDRLDGDTVLKVEGMPGWTFGMPPHDTAALPADDAMVRLCRDAVRAGRPVRVEYERTGPRSGTVLRVEAR